MLKASTNTFNLNNGLNKHLYSSSTMSALFLKHCVPKSGATGSMSVNEPSPLANGHTHHPDAGLARESRPPVTRPTCGPAGRIPQLAPDHRNRFKYERDLDPTIFSKEGLQRKSSLMVEKSGLDVSSHVQAREHLSWEVSEMSSSSTATNLSSSSVYRPFPLLLFIHPLLLFLFFFLFSLSSYSLVFILQYGLCKIMHLHLGCLGNLSPPRTSSFSAVDFLPLLYLQDLKFHFLPLMFVYELCTFSSGRYFCFVGCSVINHS